MEADFFSPATAKAVEAAVKEVELQTAAEIVVCVRRRAATWRSVDFTVGAVVGIGVLCVLLFHPMEFAVWSMPLEVAGLGLLAGLASMVFRAHRRWLVPAARRAAATLQAARAAFVELGVGRTTGRTGVVVVVFITERRVELVGDIAVDVAKLQPARDALDAAVRAADATAFVKALGTLGPLLAPLLPRSADDVNELPDAPVMS